MVLSGAPATLGLYHKGSVPMSTRSVCLHRSEQSYFSLGHVSLPLFLFPLMIRMEHRIGEVMSQPNIPQTGSHSDAYTFYTN